MNQNPPMAGFGHFCPFIICMQKPVEMSYFTIQIIISIHDTSFKKGFLNVFSKI
jgi:hypothetical protein